MQIHADLSNVPITFTAVSDGAALGSAILGAAAAGLYPDVQTAADGMVRVKSRIEPNRERHEIYKFYVDQYINTYPPMRDLMHATVRHQESQRGG